MSDERRIAIGPGEARSTKLSGPDWSFEYVEGERSFAVLWEPRESGVFLPLLLDAWTSPAETPTSEEERERIVRALWSVVEPAGVAGLLEHRTDGVEVALRLNPPDHVRIAERPPFLDYMELGRTLTLPLARDPKQPMEGIVTLSADATWTDGAPVTDAERARIAQRFQGTRLTVR